MPARVRASFLRENSGLFLTPACAGLRFTDRPFAAQSIPLYSISTPFTMEIWVKFTSSSARTIGRHIVKLMSSGGSDFRIMTCPEDIPTICTRMCGFNGIASRVIFTGGCGLNENDWTHLVISWDQNGNIGFYRNGEDLGWFASINDGGPINRKFDYTDIDAAMSFSSDIASAYLGGDPQNDFLGGGPDAATNEGTSITWAWLSGFRMWSRSFEHSDVLKMYGLWPGNQLSGTRSLDLQMDLIDCSYSPARNRLKDRSGNGRHTSVSLDLSLDCPSPVPPSYGATFGTAGGFAGPRSISLPSFTVGSSSNLVIEFWIRPFAAQANGARILDWGNPPTMTKYNVDSFIISMCPYGSCSVTQGNYALRIQLFQGTQQIESFTVFQGSTGIQLNAWSYVVLCWGARDGSGYSSFTSYLNGGLVDSMTRLAIPSVLRTSNFIGHPNEWGQAHLTGATLANLWLWRGAPLEMDVALDYYGVSDSTRRRSYGLTSEKYTRMVFQYPLSDCSTAGVGAKVVKDVNSQASMNALADGDVSFTCTSPGSGPSALSRPRILSADATGPDALEAAANFTRGQGVTTLELRCSGFGGPYRVAKVVSDAQASSTTLALPVAPSYGGSYDVSCVALATTSIGTVSLASVPIVVTIPEGPTVSSQSALFPSSDAGLRNSFPRVVFDVKASERVQIAFAAPLPSHPVGSRAPAIRLAVVFVVNEDFIYCDYDVEASACLLMRTLPEPDGSPLGKKRPVEFALTSMAPFPAVDPDNRSPPSDLAAYVNDWKWPANYTRLGLADLLGPASAVLRPPQNCTGGGCSAHVYGAQRLVNYVYSGCDAGPLGALRAWQADTCPAAYPFAFMAVASNFSHDFRHQRALYERYFYESASGALLSRASEDYRWAAMMGSLQLFRLSPKGSNLDIDAYKERFYRVHTDLLNFAATSEEAAAVAADAVGRQNLFSMTNCLDFYDAEPASAGRSFEGQQAAADVLRAYGAAPASLLLQDQRFFAFPGRGVAFFASFASDAPVAVFPLLKACRDADANRSALGSPPRQTCSLSAGVGLLAFDLAALAPPDHTHVADSVYRKLVWPTKDTAAYADLYPPPASVLAAHADGRVERDGPLLYHAVVRLPFFPASPSSAACASPLVGGVVCRGLNVAYVTAILSWSVNASSFETRPVASRTFKPSVPAPESYRTGVVLHGPPRVLRTDSIPLADSWIAANERPLTGGPGNGYLEGKWVDPPGGRFAFYVTGDKIVRIRKRNSHQSGMAGDVDGTFVYGAPGNLSSWTSVAAAAYKDGTLFVVRERHAPGSTRAFAFASSESPRPRLVKEKRLSRGGERAPSSELLRFAGVDAANFTPSSVAWSVVIAAFPANVMGAHVLDDFSSGRVFGYGGEADPTMPFAESPVLLFVVSEPPTFIKMHTRCGAATRWNWEAALFNRSIATVDLCTPLAPGRYSELEGALVDADAPQCPAGTYSARGSTSCTPCPQGTWSTNGSASCYECPIHTAAAAPGQPCAACAAGRFTFGTRSAGDCLACPTGSYLWTHPLTDRIRSCWSCAATEWSLPGASSCTPCPPGTVRNADLTGCDACKAGMHQPVGAAVCLDCPPGTWSPEGRSGNCSSCPAGLIPTAKRDGCLGCPLGHYALNGTDNCVLCPIDTFCTGRSSPIACGPGFVSDADRLQCSPCPAGSYEERPGVCQKCPLNAVAALPGASSCSACPAGSFSSADSRLCLSCGPGTYRSAGSGSCVPVEAASVAPAGAAAAAPCANGTVPNVERSECLECPKGAIAAGGECTRCPLNAVASRAGSTACRACAPGFVSAPDLASCLPCPAGQYRSASMAVCEGVPHGAVAPAGSPGYAFCGAGAIPNVFSSSAVCAPCPKGSYKSNATTCSRCPLNTVAPQLGSATCDACEPGYVSDASSQNCVPCAASFYRSAEMAACEPVPPKSVSGPGQAAPTPCAPGAVPNGPKSECIPCRKGAYENDGFCETCPHNHVSSEDGATLCEACALGSVAAADQQSCRPCGTGFYRPADSPDCLPVPAGAVAPAGSPAYELCGAGSVPNGPKSECIDCRPGSYQVGEACVACEANSAAPLPGSTSCAPCGEGFASTADGENCIPCPGGSYRHEPMVECGRAPRGAAAPPGSRNYTLCAPGHVPSAERTLCERCSPGAVEIEGQCVACVGNAYSPEAGLAACLECAPGTVVDPDGQGCSPCPAGMFRSANMSSCAECPAGHVSTPVSAACVPCANGTEASKGTECNVCRAGFFCRPPAPTAPCPDGSFSPPRTSACTPCERGHISNADRTRCVECASGTFQPDGLNSCLPCKLNTWAPRGTAGHCLECPLGTWPAIDSTKCIPCDSGTFMPNGTNTCVPCPPSHFAPKEGTPSHCTECPAVRPAPLSGFTPVLAPIASPPAQGYFSAPDRRSCVPCPRGSSRAAGAGAPSEACERCPAATFAGLEGSAACAACPAGQVPTESRTECRNCEAGFHPKGGLCALCGPLNVSSAGDADCHRCQSGYVANAARTACQPCPAGYQLKPGDETCTRCPANAVSGAGSVSCTACEAGAVSDELGSYCKLCEPGTFRNTSMPYCTPCPSGTFAKEAGAAACKGCEEAQLCPLATSQPIDLSFFRNLVGQAAQDLAGLASRRRLRALRGARRGLLGAAAAEVARSAADEEVTLLTEAVVYDTNAANVTRAEIRTEQVALQRLYRIMGALAGAVGGLLLLSGLAMACYIRRGLSVRPRGRPVQGAAAADAGAREARRLQRRATLAKLDLLFTEDVAAAKRPVAERIAVRRAQRAAEAEAEAERAAGGGRRASEADVAIVSKSGMADLLQIALDERPAHPPSPRAPGEPREGPRAPEFEESPKSVAGAVATLVAVGLALLAAAFVILQFAIANYEVVQTLLPGTSPSAAAIAGPVEVSASFLGWSAARACVVRREAAVNSSLSLGAANATEEGAVVTWRNIVPLDGSPPPAATAAYDAPQRACRVTWRCESCRIASTSTVGSGGAEDVAVDFRLVARTAFALALRYSVMVPAYASISGAVTTHAYAGASERLAVFRGTRPVTVPVLLTPLHFENAADGWPQYDAALQQADNRPAELDETSFGLCSLTRQLSEPECAVEAVGFRAALGVNDVYLLVSRVTRASALDALADVASLAGAALALGGQLVVSYYAALSAYAMRREILERVRAAAGRGGSGGEKRAAPLNALPAPEPPAPPPQATPVRRARTASMVEIGQHAPPSGPEPPPVRRARAASMVEIGQHVHAPPSGPEPPPVRRARTASMVEIGQHAPPSGPEPPPVRRARAASMVEIGQHAPPSGPEPPPVRRARAASMVDVALAAPAAPARPPAPPPEHLTPHGIRQGRSNSLPLLFDPAPQPAPPPVSAAPVQSRPPSTGAAAAGGARALVRRYSFLGPASRSSSASASALAPASSAPQPRSEASLPEASGSRRHSVVQAVVVDDRRAEPDSGRSQPPPRSVPLLSPLWAAAEDPAPPPAGTPGEEAEPAPLTVQTSAAAEGQTPFPHDQVIL
eukprot:tig00000473_g1206.t1